MGEPHGKSLHSAAELSKEIAVVAAVYSTGARPVFFPRVTVKDKLTRAQLLQHVCNVGIDSPQALHLVLLRPVHLPDIAVPSTPRHTLCLPPASRGSSATAVAAPSYKLQPKLSERLTRGGGVCIGRAGAADPARDGVAGGSSWQ